MSIESASSTVITWVLTATPRPGKMEELRQLMADMVAASHAEPGTQIYEWTLAPDQTVLHVLERYQDSAAVAAHMSGFRAFAERFMACLAPTGLTVYGHLDEVAQKVLAPMKPNAMLPFGGFAR